MEALLIAVVGLMLAARPFAGEVVAPAEPARLPRRPRPRGDRARGREDDLHVRRLAWLRADLDRAGRDGDGEQVRRLSRLLRAEEVRHEASLGRIPD